MKAFKIIQSQSHSPYFSLLLSSHRKVSLFLLQEVLPRSLNCCSLFTIWSEMEAPKYELREIMIILLPCSPPSSSAPSSQDGFTQMTELQTQWIYTSSGIHRVLVPSELSLDCSSRISQISTDDYFIYTLFLFFWRECTHMYEWWEVGAWRRRECQADSALSVERNVRLDLVTLRS